MNSKTLTSRTAVEVALPSRTLQRLCKHFSHKVEAKWNDEDGVVNFVAGSCTLRAGERVLEITCTACNEEELQGIEQTLERHLPAMAAAPAASLAFSWKR